MEEVEHQEEMPDIDTSLCRGGEIVEGEVDEKNIYQHHDTHPLVLALFTTKLMGGVEWVQWEPETLRIVLSQRDRVVSECNWNKLQACKTVLANPAAVFDRWECFLPVCTALNNVIPDPTTLQIPSLARLLFGVTAMKTLDPQEDFSTEVRRVMAASLLYRGIFLVPDELQFIQHLLIDAHYVCPDCGNEEKVIEDFDGVCDNCGTNWYDTAAGKAIKDPRVQLVAGREIAPYKAHLQWVSANYDAWVPDEDNPLDIQVARVLEAVSYNARKTAQFLNQKDALGLDAA